MRLSFATIEPTTRSRRPALLLLASAVSTCAWAGAWAGEPLALSNPSLLAHAATLPELGHSTTTAAGTLDLRLSLDLSNEFHQQTDGAASVVLDGELQQWTLGLRYGLSPRLDLALEVPLQQLSGGRLDSTIEGWHDFFGLPDGGRTGAPQDRLLVQLSNGADTLLTLDEDARELGDVRIGAGWALLPGAALRAQLKLPSGDETRLAGGSGGAALWLDMALPLPRPWSGFVTLGGSFSDAQGPLSELQNEAVGFGGLGLAWQFTAPVSLMAQAYWHSRLYDDPAGAALDNFREGLQGALALRWQPQPRGFVDLGFQEDLITASSADFSLHLRLGWQLAR